MSLREVFLNRVNKFQNTIDFTDFINCLNIVEFNLVGKDNEVYKKLKKKILMVYNNLKNW